MSTPTRKKPLQHPLAPAISKAEKRVRVRQQPPTLLTRTLISYQERMKAHSATLPTCCTLLELVQYMNNFTASDVETVAVVTSLVNSGRVRLRGTFAGATISFSPQRVRRHRHSAADPKRAKHNDE